MSSATDVGRRQLVGKGSVYTVATLLQLVGAVLVVPALSRILSRAEYGQVALATVVTLLLGLVVTLGLPAVITREYFAPKENSEEDGPRAARRAAGSAVVIGFLLGMVVLATAPLWSLPIGGLTISLSLGIATGATWSWIVVGQAILRAAHQARRFVIVAAVNVVGGQLLGLAAVIFVSHSAVAYLLGLAAGSLIASLLCLYWTQPIFRGWFAWPALSRHLAIALPTVPHTAALFLMLWGDRFVIAAQRGDDAVAAYSLAYQTGAIAISLIAAANNAWAPLIYGASTDRRWPLLAATTTDMLRLAALCAAGLAFCAPLALSILADPSKYDIAELVPVVALTALAAVPYTLYLSGAHMLFWSGWTAPLLWITPLAMVFNLVGKASVLPWAGFTGAAVITVLAYGLLSLLVVHVSRKIGDVPWSGRAVTCAAAAAACALGALIPMTLYGHVARAVLAVVVAILAFRVIRQLVNDTKKPV